MNRNPLYTAFHPRWFRTRVSTYWWLARWSYFVFVLREMSSIFVAWFILYLLLLIRAVSQGPSPYQQFLDWSAHPVVLVLNLVTLFFVVFHAITWFNLAPQAMAVHMRGKRVPPTLIAASNYVAWILVSGLVIAVVLGS